jgi:hypothetical protein
MRSVWDHVARVEQTDFVYPKNLLEKNVVNTIATGAIHRREYALFPSSG